MIKKVVISIDATESHRFNTYKIKWYLFSKILIWSKTVEFGFGYFEDYKCIVKV